MKLERISNSKKILITFVSFLLLAATSLGILFGTNRNVSAATNSFGHYVQTFKGITTVTDDGIEVNSYLEFDTSVCDRVSDMISEGIRYVTVALDFDMREINDGYQHIYVYSHGVQRRHVELNYYGNDKIDAYHNVKVYFESIPLYDCIDQNFKLDIVIRFDASGSLEDTWQFQNMAVTVRTTKFAFYRETTTEGEV